MPKKDKPDWSEVRVGLDPSDEQGDRGDEQPAFGTQRVADVPPEDPLIASSVNFQAGAFPGQTYTPSGDWQHRLNDPCPQCKRTGNVRERGTERLCTKCGHEWGGEAA